MKIVRIRLTPQSVRAVGVIAILATMGSVVSIVVGCGDDNNRVPTKAEVQAADVNRQANVDKMNIPEDQKAAFKAHMGGPAVPNPATAAQNAAAPKDRR